MDNIQKRPPEMNKSFRHYIVNIYTYFISKGFFVSGIFTDFKICFVDGQILACPFSIFARTSQRPNLKEAVKVGDLSIRLSLRKVYFELCDQTAEQRKHSLSARIHGHYWKGIRICTLF